MEKVLAAEKPKKYKKYKILHILHTKHLIVRCAFSEYYKVTRTSFKTCERMENGFKWI